MVSVLPSFDGIAVCIRFFHLPSYVTMCSFLLSNCHLSSVLSYIVKKSSILYSFLIILHLAQNKFHLDSAIILFNNVLHNINIVPVSINMLINFLLNNVSS